MGCSAVLCPLGFEVHELSVCAALLEQVSTLAAARQSTGIRRITIEVGALSGVDAAQLRTAFQVLRAGSCAAGADLVIDAPEVRIRCNTCDAVSAVAPNRLLCGQCGSYRSHVVQGDELRLRRVELYVKESPCASNAVAA